MTEITTRDAQVLRGTAPTRSSGSRYTRAPALVVRWGLVIVATIVWLTVVPLVAVAREFRRALTRQLS